MSKTHQHRTTAAGQPVVEDTAWEGPLDLDTLRGNAWMMEQLRGQAGGGGGGAGAGVSEADVEAHLDALKADREARLDMLISGEIGGLPSAASPMPEDLSATPKRYRIDVSHGAMREHAAATARDLASFGQQEDFSVLLTGIEGSTAELTDVPNLERQEYPYGDTWIEDSGHIGRDGSLTLLPGLEGSDATEAASAARRQREAEHAQTHPDKPMKIRGAVGDTVAEEPAATRAQVAFGLAQGKSMRMALSYCEGGNVLTGVNAAGEPYAIVGKDSLAMSQALLSHECSARAGREILLEEEEVKLIIAKDLGVSMENLAFVEQPNDFHIDMALMPWKDGGVLLNDCQAAERLMVEELLERLEADVAKRSQEASGDAVAEIQATLEVLQQVRAHGGSVKELMGFQKQLRASKGQTQAAREVWSLCNQLVVDLMAIRKDTRDRAVVEDAIAEQLQSAGLDVHRVPGRFREGFTDETANFLNGQGGTNRDGEQFFITQDGPKRYREAFEAALPQEETPTRLHYYDAAASKASLSNKGGLNCRTKVAESW